MALENRISIHIRNKSGEQLIDQLRLQAFDATGQVMHLFQRSLTPTPATC